MITPLAAAKAYASTQAGVAGASGAAGAAASSFAVLVKGDIETPVQTSKAAEALMAARLKGKAERVDVVTAVAAAEASLETVMAVRDQVIAAYQEIMRMPI